MSQTNTLLFGVKTESAPVVTLTNIQTVTNCKQQLDAKTTAQLDTVVVESEGKWLSHDEVKRRLGL